MEAYVEPFVFVAEAIDGDQRLKNQLQLPENKIFSRIEKESLWTNKETAGGETPFHKHEDSSLRASRANSSSFNMHIKPMTNIIVNEHLNIF